MNMAGYTKLFNSILASTIWRADDKTRIVWITLLAMADKDGIAEGSIPGLADLARVSIEDCEAALAELMAPDKYSRTSEFEGRRIEAVDGGWLLLNHAKYRAKMSEDDIRERNRQRQAKWREKNKPVTHDVTESNTMSQNVTECNAVSRQSRHTEAEANTKEEERLSQTEIKINELRKDAFYSHVDFDRELEKAQRWINEHPPRKFTFLFFKKWIDKIEPPIDTKKLIQSKFDTPALTYDVDAIAEEYARRNFGE